MCGLDGAGCPSSRRSKGWSGVRPATRSSLRSAARGHNMFVTLEFYRTRCAIMLKFILSHGPSFALVSGSIRGAFDISAFRIDFRHRLFVEGDHRLFAVGPSVLIDHGLFESTVVVLSFESLNIAFSDSSYVALRDRKSTR